jgi:N-methylhydantoinase B
VQCTWCGHELARGGERWKDRAVRRSLPISAAGEAREAAPGLVLRQFCCPQCATALDLEVVLESDPPLYDDVRKWPAAPANGRAGRRQAA